MPFCSTLKFFYCIFFYIKRKHEHYLLVISLMWLRGESFCYCCCRDALLWFGLSLLKDGLSPFCLEFALLHNVYVHVRLTYTFHCCLQHVKLYVYFWDKKLLIQRVIHKTVYWLLTIYSNLLHSIAQYKYDTVYKTTIIAWQISKWLNQHFPNNLYKSVWIAKVVFVLSKFAYGRLMVA